MNRRRSGNPKKQSRFICLKCGKMDGTMNGIQRIHGQREKGHVKDLYCVHCKEITKCLEVRWCDYLPDMTNRSEKMRSKYYSCYSCHIAG